MQYMKLDTNQREAFMATLDGMPAFLRSVFAELSPAETLARGADGTFAPVEQVWHLADLEREGFGERIRRLLVEPQPYLPDFDGERAAAERNYRALSLEDGLQAFADARRANIAALRALDSDSWLKTGTQEEVGPVSLCDIPAFMSQHDAAHRAEIEMWKQSQGPK